MGIFSYVQVAMKLQPTDVENHRLFVNVTRCTKDDGVLRRLLDFAKDDHLVDQDKVRVHFALGKLYEDLGEYQKAFQHIDFGNHLQMQILNLNYISAEQNAVFQRLQKFFSPEVFQRYSECGLEDETPVFVLGLSRSGKSLSEK